MSHKDLNLNVHSSFIHNILKLEISQMSIKHLEKQIVVYPYKG